MNEFNYGAFKFSLIPFTFCFICDTTSGVHIENNVFSNGFTLPISSSDTVRPRPIENKLKLIHIFFNN